MEEVTRQRDRYRKECEELTIKLKVAEFEVQNQRVDAEMNSTNIRFLEEQIEEFRLKEVRQLAEYEKRVKEIKEKMESEIEQLKLQIENQKSALERQRKDEERLRTEINANKDKENQSAIEEKTGRLKKKLKISF